MFQKFFDLIKVIALTTVIAQQTAWAEGAPVPPHERKGFKEAHDKCVSQFGKPEPGKKPNEAFENCMTAAGFERPPHPPHHGPHHPPPPPHGPEGENETSEGSQP